jgi:hypothetical protein
LGIFLKSRAGAKADSTKDALDIRINLLSFTLFYGVFRLGRNRFSMKEGFYFSIVVEKSGHIDDEVSSHGEKRKRSNKGGFSQ